MKTHTCLLGLILWLPAAGVHAALTQVQYAFATTVQSVDPGAPGFPAQLATVSVGDSLSGVLTYETASPTVSLGLGGIYDNATKYTLQDASFMLDVSGHVYNVWTGQMYAFVWNDDPALGGADGLIFTNLAPLGSPQFQLGNINLPGTVLGDTSLPATDLGGGYFLTLGSSSQPDFWIRSNGISGLDATLVPEPGICLLFGLGLSGLLCIARNRAAEGHPSH